MIALAIGVAACMALSSVALLAPSAHPSTAQPTRSTSHAVLPIDPRETRPSGLPKIVDPQFLPTVLNNPLETANGGYGGSVAVYGSTVAAGASGDFLNLSGNLYYGAVSVQNLTTGARTTFIPYPGSWGNGFGDSVALGGNHLVVGAPNALDFRGLVYIFNYTQVESDGFYSIELTGETVWASPFAANGTYGDYFGFSVSISGSTVAVGAPGENDSATVSAGEVFLIDLTNGEYRMVSSPSPQTGGDFGNSVALSGSELAVGAPWEEAPYGGPSSAGVAYLFNARTGDLLATFASPTPVTDGLFGARLAVNGSYLAVSSIYESGAGVAYSGTVHLFNLANGTNVTLVSPDPTVEGLFGLGIAMSSTDLAVGAPLEERQGSVDTGSAYLYALADPFNVNSSFAVPNWQFAAFGYSVALNRTAVIAGAPWITADNLSESGQVYVFSQVPLLIESLNPTGYGFFGASVSVDGSSVYGAPYEYNDGDYEAGNAYVLVGHTGPFVALENPAPQVEAYFGNSVSIWGNTIAVGAPYENLSTNTSGAVFLYNATTLAPTRSLISPNGQNFGGFGQAVATNGKYVVVGAPYEGDDNNGNAYVFLASTGTLVATLADPFAGPGDEFGWSVNISAAGLVIVGAPGIDTAFVYQASNGALLAILYNPGYGGNGFGYSVAIGTTAVVGAPGQYAAGDIAAGEVYIFSTSGALLHSVVSLNPTEDGLFGISVAEDDGVIVAGAVYETAFGVPAAGNVYLIGATSGTIFDRYNDPTPTSDAEFGYAVAIGPAGVIVVGAPFDASGAGAATLFFN